MLAAVFTFSKKERMDERKEGIKRERKKNKKLPPPPSNMVLCVAQASFELVVLDFALLNAEIIGMPSK